MVDKITNFVKRGRFALVGAVFALTVVSAGAATIMQPSASSAAACDRVNIVYCGLDGSTLGSYVNSFRDDYNRGSDSGHNDLKTVFRWAGATDAKVAGMNTSNTKLGTLYRNGDIKVDGRVVGHDSWVSARFTEGAGFVQISNGVWARKTTTSFAQASTQVIVHMNANGVADFAVMVDCGNAVRFTPTPQPKPALDCVNLSKEKLANRRFSFTAKARADNTRITKYVFTFGDGSQDTVRTDNQTASIKHEYDKFDKSYDVRVTVFSNDFTQGKTSRDCALTATTSPEPRNPSLACVSLTGYGNELKYTFNARAAAKDTTIKSYTFHFSDGKTKTVKTSAKSATTTYTFAKRNTTYTVYVTITSSDKATKKTPACTMKLTTPKEDECKPGVPIGSPECEECLPGIPVGSPECFPPTPTSETPATPASLAKTGPGSLLAIFGGTSLLGGLFHRLVLRKFFA